MLRATQEMLGLVARQRGHRGRHAHAIQPLTVDDTSGPGWRAREIGIAGAGVRSSQMRRATRSSRPWSSSRATAVLTEGR
jgi:hypothetical protein